MIPEIEPLFQLKKRFTDLNPSFQHDSKKLNFFQLNPSFQHNSKNWTFYNVSQRIELFTMCLKELNFLQCVSKNWTFCNVSQRIEFFFEYWLKELNFFLEDNAKNWTFYESKNWTLFKMIQRTNFLHIFQYIEFFEYDSKNWTIKKMTFFFEERKTQIIEPFFWWLKELTSFQHDSQNWTNFYDYYRIEPFFSTWISEIEHFFCWQIWLKVLVYPLWKICLKELNSLFEYESKNWTLSFLKNDSKNWTSFSKWLKELNHLFNMTQRYFEKQLEESNTLFLTTQRMQPSKKIKGLNLLSKWWVKELLLFSNQKNSKN